MILSRLNIQRRREAQGRCEPPLGHPRRKPCGLALAFRKPKRTLRSCAECISCLLSWLYAYPTIDVGVFPACKFKRRFKGSRLDSRKPTNYRTACESSPATRSANRISTQCALANRVGMAPTSSRHRAATPALPAAGRACGSKSARHEQYCRSGVQPPLFAVPVEPARSSWERPR